MVDHVAYKSKEQTEALARLRANPRVELISVAGPEDCSTAQTVQGSYSKNDVPELPITACSRPGGCICAYKPVLNDIYP
jgi:hypothetical protein